MSTITSYLIIYLLDFVFMDMFLRSFAWKNILKILNEIFLEYIT